MYSILINEFVIVASYAVYAEEECAVLRQSWRLTDAFDKDYDMLFSVEDDSFNDLIGALKESTVLHFS